MKAAFVALDECKFWQVSFLLRLLRQADWQVRTLTFQANDIMTDSGVSVKANASIEDAAPWDYHLVILAGGRIVDEEMQNPHLHRFLRQYDATRRPIAAVCNSVSYLAAAGLLGGTRFAASVDTVAASPHLYTHAVPMDNATCHDANLWTAQSEAYLFWTQQVTQALSVPNSF
jgi:putative intracellular protease/amidase